jgi:MinD superfamily P-loop ATPase
MLRAKPPQADREQGMRLVIASGKGGTGKTTVGTSLASLLAEGSGRVTYADCDAEEPNGHLILRPDVQNTTDVHVRSVSVDEARCTGCCRCARACQFHALACVSNTVAVFPQLCHACGACALVCPVDAIVEVPRKVGIIREGSVGSLRFLGGEMTVGEESVVPIVRALKTATAAASGTTEEIVVLDAPPGTACPAVETMRGADRAILVTEPTPFGMHDLSLAVETVRELGVPASVVINRCDIGTDDTREYCRSEGLDILLEIPNSRDVARAYSEGTLPITAVPAFREIMLGLALEVRNWCGELQRT